MPFFMYGPRFNHRSAEGVTNFDDLLQLGSMNKKMYGILNVNFKVG